MADENDKGIQRSKPLPKGMGNGKTNAQVFGIIGQQVMRINQLNKTLDTNLKSLEGSLVEHAADQFNIGENQIRVLQNISGCLNEMKGMLDPVSRYFLEANEDSLGARGGTAAGAVEPVTVPFDVDTGDTDQKVNKTTGAFGKLASTLGSLGGAGAAGRVAGGAAGGAAGGTVMGVLGAVGIGLGAVGLGLATITGALYLGAAAVDKFGEGLTSVAEGMDDLNRLDISVEKFENLGVALGALTKDVGIMGGLGLMAIASADLNNLASGIEALNNAEYDPQNLLAAGEAIESFVEQLNNDIIGGITASLIDDNLIPLAKGMEALSVVKLPDDFEEQMARGGKGLGNLIDASGGFLGNNVLQTGALQAIDDNLITIANGAQALADVDLPADFEARMTLLGVGLDRLIGESSGFLGFGNLLAGMNLQAIDDNLEPIADGINKLNETDSKKFAQTGTFIGHGFQKIFDGTDDLFGVIGAQLIDDNLPMIVQGIDMMNATDSKKFAETGANIGSGFQDIFDGTDDLLGVIGAQAIDDNLGVLAAGIQSLNEIDTPDVDHFQAVGASINNLLRGFTGESAPGEDDGFLDAFADGWDRFTSMFTMISVRGITEPLNSLSGSLQELQKVSATEVDFSNVAASLISLMQNINDKAIGDDFDYLYDLHEELERMNDEVDISKLTAIADQVERLRGTGFAPIPNLEGDTLTQGAVLSEVQQSVVSNQTNVSMQGGTSQFVDATSTKNVFIAPVTPSVFISK